MAEQSSLRYMDMGQIAEWAQARDKIRLDDDWLGADVEHAMWVAYKLGYMRCRQELESCKNPHEKFEKLVDDVILEGGFTESEHNLRALTAILDTEPRFEP